jgi:hypothetical protein
MATSRSPCGSADSAGKTVKVSDPQVLTIAPSSPVTRFPNIYSRETTTRGSEQKAPTLSVAPRLPIGLDFTPDLLESFDVAENRRP